jgi:hypothetical protein
MPRSNLVYCNENGYWKFVKSDRYGFNENPDDLFEQADIVLIGDSFAAGGCVNEPDTIAGVLRANGLQLLNLGAPGGQPLEELGTIKEYLPTGKTLIWVFFEGNDYRPSLNRRLLRNYLQPDFTQHLKQKPEEIKGFIEATEGRVWELAERGTPVGRQKWQDRLRDMLRPTMSFLQSFRAAGLKFDTAEYEEVLREGKRAAIEKGFKTFLVVYLPCWERFEWMPRTHPQVGKFNALRKAVTATASSAGFSIIDVTNRFYDEPDPRSLYPFSSHGHLTVRGYRITAQAILHYLFEGR